MVYVFEFELVFSGNMIDNCYNQQVMLAMRQEAIICIRICICIFIVFVGFYIVFVY